MDITQPEYSEPDHEQRPRASYDDEIVDDGPEVETVQLPEPDDA